MTENFNPEKFSKRGGHFVAGAALQPCPALCIPACGDYNAGRGGGWFPKPLVMIEAK
ncbi:hypothetical protein [Azospirillum argentinense]